MEKHIADTGGNESSGGEPHPSSSFEEAKKCWVEKEFNQEFFKVKVVAIPELGNGPGGKGPVSIPECPETRHSAAGYDGVAPNRDREEVLPEGRNQHKPANIHRVWCMSRPSIKRLLERGDVHRSMNELGEDQIAER